MKPRQVEPDDPDDFDPDEPADPDDFGGRQLICHVEVPATGPFAGSPVFCCSLDEEQPRKCAYCDRAGVYLCDWPAEKIVEVDWRDIRHGEVWVTEKNGHRGTVVSIESLTPENGLRFWVKLPGRKDPYPYDRIEFRPHGKTLSVRPGTCDAPACDLHVREVGDDRHYCASCWRAQAAAITGEIER